MIKIHREDVRGISDLPVYSMIYQYFRIYSMNFTKKVPKILRINVGYINMKSISFQCHTQQIKISFNGMSGHVSEQKLRQVLVNNNASFWTCGKICSRLQTPLYRGIVLASIISYGTVVVAIMNNRFTN